MSNESMNNKTDNKLQAANTGENRRRAPRQHVVLKAKLDTGSYEFECVAYDLSVCGVKVKLDLPIKTECEVWMTVKDSPHIPAKVVTAEGGYVGLEFTLSQIQVQQQFKSIGLSLPRG